MSKTTKIIAALGVVAGLGVAALPAFTYATSVSGNADVIVEVGDAIAMSIVGNQDGVQGSGYNNVNIKSAEIDTIGQNIDISDFDYPTATTTSGSKIDILPFEYKDGNNTNNFKSAVTVYTNANYYGLSIKAQDGTALVNQSDNSATIPAGTIEAPATTFDLAAGTSAWGYKVNTPAEGGAGYKAITAGDVEINEEAALATGNTTNVYYGVATSATQKTGTYKGTVVYTATTKNAAGN